MAHVIATAAVVLALVAPAFARAQTAAGSRILVVPFENVQREPKLYWLSEASAMLLADELRIRGLAPIPRDDPVTSTARP